jgi:hypothetical protein
MEIETMDTERQDTVDGDPLRATLLVLLILVASVAFALFSLGVFVGSALHGRWVSIALVLSYAVGFGVGYMRKAPGIGL